MERGAFGLLGVLVLAAWPSTGQYVTGTFFSLVLLLDGPGLIVTGFGGRRVVGLVSGRPADEEGARGHAAGARDGTGEPPAKRVQPE